MLEELDALKAKTHVLLMFSTHVNRETKEKQTEMLTVGQKNKRDI